MSRCPNCQATFTTPDVWTWHRSDDGRCINPATIGLVLVNGSWAFPSLRSA